MRNTGKNAFLVISGVLKSRSFVTLTEALTHAAKQQGVDLSVHSNLDFVDARRIDALPDQGIFWDKDVRLAALMEQRGKTLYNSAHAIATCDDKAATFLALAPHQIPMPDTLLVPSTYESIGYPVFDFLDDAASRLGWPMIVKEAYGSFGEQVYLVHNRDEAIALLKKLAGKPAIFQQFIKESAGRDLRVYVVGGEAVGAIARENHQGNFRANVAVGSGVSPHRLTTAERDLALAATSALGLAFGGVDILLSNHGPLICEVNSNAHFAALSEATGVNPADHIVRLIR